MLSSILSTSLSVILRCGGVAALASPVGVEEFAPRTVNSLVGVSAEIVALSLKQVSGQILAAVAVIVVEGRRHCGQRNAVGYCGGANAPPASLRALHNALEIWVEQQVGQGGVIVKGFLYLAEENAPDNAAASPHKGDAAVVEIPIICLCGRAHEGVALSVGNYLRRKECVFDIVDELLPVAAEFGLRAVKHLGGADPLLFHGAQAP